MAPQPMSDSELASAAARGDEEAFSALVRAHVDAVYGHALRFFGDPHMAEDATQEVFVKMFRQIGSFDGRSKLSTWLYRVTRNVCLDIVRSGKRLPDPVDPATLEPLSAEDFADDVVLGQALEEAVATLPREDREAFSAVTLFGLSYGEAATALVVPIGTVKSRVFRARRSLAAILLSAEGGDADGVPARL